MSAGWSREVALDQAIGLAVHAGIVFVRGVLPAVLVTGIACLLWRRRRGLDPGAFATLAVSVVLAAPIAFLALTWPIRPHLRVGGAADAITTYVLLAAVAAGAELLARRGTRRSVAPDRPGPP